VKVTGGGRFGVGGPNSLASQVKDPAQAKLGRATRPGGTT